MDQTPTFAGMRRHNDALHKIARVAADVMTTEVISVGVGTTVHDAAEVMRSHRLGAVPVLDADQKLVGMLSDGDLLGRSEADRGVRSNWWLPLFGASHALPTDLGASGARLAREMMHAPAITVERKTPLDAIAETLRAHTIKRVPVVDGDRLVGIISRADLLPALETLRRPTATAEPSGGFLSMLVSMADSIGLSSKTGTPPETSGAPPPTVTADAFAGLVANSEQAKQDARHAADDALKLTRARQLREMLQRHVDAAMWTEMLGHAREAAARGEESFQLLRFPCDLCSDNGRMIEIGQADWPTTLRGEAADVYARWEKDLHPAGFGLASQIVDFPDGMPGDAALFLTWRRP